MKSTDKTVEKQPDALEAISETIRNRLVRVAAPFMANDNIAEYIQDGEMSLLHREVEQRVAALLRSLVIDTENDHNTTGTAGRVAKMLLTEVYSGRYRQKPVTTSFPNIKNVDQCYVVGPIAVRSCCAHHLVPIIGQCWIGTIPDPDHLIGLSKHHRLVEWIMARPQIQEEAIEQLANELETSIGNPRGLGIIMRAKHLCCGWRGVKDDESLMTSSVMRGLFKTDQKARQEFLSLIKGMGFE